MIEAILMVGNRIAGVHPLSYPIPCLRIELAFILSPISMSAVEETATAGFSVHSIARNRIIFDLVDRIGYDKYVYQYRQAELYEKYAIDIQANPTPFEPTEKVNMDILKKKLRQKEKMKELLLRYYRSEQ